MQVLIKNPRMFLRKNKFIPYHLQKRKKEPPFKIEEFEELMNLSIDHLQKLPNLVKLNDEFKDVLIIGDTHGFIESTIRIVRSFLKEQVTSLIFLGDYVDRGKHSLVNLSFILSLMIAFPSNVLVLRGNHEDFEINQVYGFHDELLSYYNYNDFKKMLDLIENIYHNLPLAAVTPKRSACFHGGISQTMESINDLEIIPKPHTNIDTISDENLRKKALNLYKQIRWNDPCEDQEEDFLKTERGYYCFNFDVTERFLVASNLKRIIRGHEAVRGGFMSLFGGKILHVHSAEPPKLKFLKGAVIHEQADCTTVLRDIDFNLIGAI